MLDIIIPAYNSRRTIRRTLISILNQSLVDKYECKIYIVNDGGDTYYDIIDEFKNHITITEIDSETNQGPGPTRQLGFDSTSNDFVTFIDSDDLIEGYFSLESAYREIENSDFNVVVTPWLYQPMYDIPNFEYHQATWTNMPGKIYRRKFLTDNGIRFQEGFREVSEDLGFNLLVSTFVNDEDVKVLDKPFYLSMFNPSSLTKKEDYQIRNLHCEKDQILYAINKSIELHGGLTIKILSLIYDRLLRFYFTYIKYYYENPTISNTVFEVSIDYVKQLNQYIDMERDKQVITSLYWYVYGTGLQANNIIPFVDLFTWVRELKNQI